MATSSKVAELKKRFEATQKVTLTPEQHAATLRQKQRDQEEAVRIAKSRAARYNMTLRSLELTNAAQVSEARKQDRAKKDDTMKSFQQPGRRVSGLKKTTQARVEASQSILASALSHNRSPAVAMDVVRAVAAQVDETIKTAEPATKDDEAKAKKDAEAEALAFARLEEEARLAEEAREKALQEAAAKAAAEAEAAAKAAEEARKAAEAAEASRAVELKKQAEAEEERARQAKAEAEAAAAAVTAEEAVPEEEPSIDDGAKFEMTSLNKALEQGNDDAINKAIVTDFLKEHDPAKVDEVDKIMAENKGQEGKLMQDLVAKYSDPVATEIKVTAEVIVQIEGEGKTDSGKEDESLDENSIEQQRKEAERIKMDEESRIAAMDETEKKIYMEQLAAQTKHQEEKDKMLKSQLNVYGSSGAAALLGGRGRGRGKARPKSDRQTEYIVNGINEGGQWEVNAE